MRALNQLVEIIHGAGSLTMQPRINVITLGVDDLHASVAFYTALGLKTDGIVGEEFEHGAVAFFALQPGLMLALWPRISIAHDTGLPHSASHSNEMTLGHNVNSKEEVDAVMASATSAGAMIIKPAQATFWGGYAGYFQDLDGHVWEAVWNPQLVVD